MMNSDNFASANAASSLSSKSKVTLELASAWRRFINYLVDLLGCTVFTFVLAVILAFFVAVWRPSMLISIGKSIDKLDELLFGFVLTFLYYFLSEALFGRTLGKLLTRTRTVSAEGGAPSKSQLIYRTLMRFIPLDAFTFLRARPIGMHDRMSGTRVVRIRKSR